MTAEGKTTTKGMRQHDIVLTEETASGALRPTARKGPDTIACRVVGMEAIPGRLRTGRRAPTRIAVKLIPLLADPDPVIVSSSASQTWWLASASAYWRKTLAAQGITTSR